MAKLRVELRLHAIAKELDGNKEIGQKRYKAEEEVLVNKNAWDKRWAMALNYLRTGKFTAKKKR